ncbi:dihydroxyacetone kinase subunit L [uncultured Roseobacter sp.]|uniref:dihydroxyacetone kinase subunit L n=1 Tax=uncultured Roseobacter sp. TaxID=114847 RepID=UPI00260F62A6|nr:dihydroxyacetone kinase subunit L [uncultured Roseobacter sp.]
MALTTETLKLAIEKIHSKITPIGDEMNSLDGKLGDGDLGVTLVNGFNNLNGIKDDLPEDTGMALFAMAKSVTAVSGSSFGTLLATALMAAGKNAKGQRAIAWSDIGTPLQAAQDAMIARGGANLGDKTMLDVMDAIIAAVTDIDDPDRLRTAAIKATIQTVEEFRNKPNKIGRARVYADKSIGMDDPGMMALLRLLECL